MFKALEPSTHAHDRLARDGRYPPMNAVTPSPSLATVANHLRLADSRSVPLSERVTACEHITRSPVASTAKARPSTHQHISQPALFLPRSTPPLHSSEPTGTASSAHCSAVSGANNSPPPKKKETRIHTSEHTAMPSTHTAMATLAVQTSPAGWLAAGGRRRCSWRSKPPTSRSSPAAHSCLIPPPRPRPQRSSRPRRGKQTGPRRRHCTLWSTRSTDLGSCCPPGSMVWTLGTRCS